MSRWFPWRTQLSPGPLKFVQPGPLRSPVSVTSLALTAAVLAAVLALMPHLSQQVSVDPTPMVESQQALAEPEARVYAASELPDSIAPAPPTVQAAATVSAGEPGNAPGMPPAAEATRPAEKKLAPSAPGLTQASLFEADRLPTLEADGAEFDSVAAPPASAPRSTARVPRRAAVASRNPATAEPTQP